MGEAALRAADTVLQPFCDGVSHEGTPFRPLACVADKPQKVP